MGNVPKSKLKEIREALASQVSEYTGIDTRPYVPDSITPPMIAVQSDQNYASYGVVIGESVMGDFTGYTEGVGVKEYSLQLLILVSRASSMEQAQEDIDDLIDGDFRGNGKLPVPQAIAIDPTLGGVVDYCESVRVSNVGMIEISGQSYFSARVSLVVSK